MNEGTGDSFAAEPEARDPLQRRALATLSVGLALGVLTQALFWNARVGLNWLLLDVILVATCVLAFRRGPLSVAAWGAATASILFGMTIVLHRSSWSLVIALPWNLALLAALPFLVADRVTLKDLAAVPARMLASFMRTPKALSFLARLPADAAGHAQRGPAFRIVKGLAIGVPIALIFVALFSIDPQFQRALRFASRRSGDAIAFAFWALFTGAIYLFLYGLKSNGTHASEPPPVKSEEAGGKAADQVPATGVATAYRDWTVPEAPTSPATPVALARVAQATWVTVLVPVTLVFALFVGVNLRQLFGGHALVRAATGPTYAYYLHAGFSQLLIAAVLSVCLVLVGHMLLRPARATAVLSVVEVTLLALTGVTLLSCAQRLAIYEEAYGATYLRLGVAVIEIGVLGVLLLTMAKSITRTFSTFGGVVLTWFVGLSLGASAFNADAYIALRNLDRASHHRIFDEYYLFELSADAWTALNHPYLRVERPDLRVRLQETWAWSLRSRDWRSLRGVSHAP